MSRAKCISKIRITRQFPAPLVEDEVTFQEFPARPCFPGFYKIIHECFQFSQIACGNPWASPLQRQSFQFDTQSVQLTHFFRAELGDEGAGVRDPSYETLPLQTNESLPDHWRADLH